MSPNFFKTPKKILREIEQLQDDQAVPKPGVVVMCIFFLGYFEANVLENAPFQPHTWLRYIDDSFMI